MADIHIYTAGSEPRVYPEEGIVGMLKSGELSPEMFFWREGMAEWEPLAKFQVKPPAPPHETIAPPRRTEPLPDISAGRAARAEAAPQPIVEAAAMEHVTGRQRFRFRNSPEPLTTIVQVLLIICICVAALELANAVVHYEDMTSGASTLTTPDPNSAAVVDGAPSASPDESSPAPDVADDIGGMLEWGGWMANGLLIVPYFMWLYRTSQNCRHFSLIMRFKPKWAVACHFVPPMNAFRPCQVMQEIWRVSNNPRTWHNDRRSVLVGIWWALTVSTIGLAIFNYVQSREAETADDHVQVEQAFLALKVLQLAWYGTFIALVTTIIQKQRSVIQKSKRRAEEEAAEKA
jgi:hypothetical protein